MIVYDSPSARPAWPLVQFLLTFLVGSLSSRRSALALTAVVPNADAAPPIVNAIILPLLFLSGIFIPLGDEAPEWMRTVANIFPVKPFADALFGSAFGEVTVQTPVGPVHPFPFDVVGPARRRGLGCRGPRARGPVLHLGTPQVAEPNRRLC